MRVFALTGGIGSGKSTVARLFAERGVPVVDADRVAREVVAAGSPTLAKVVGAFGPQVLGPGGALDRAALGRLVFGDPDLRDKLNAIVHPEIKLRVEKRWQDLAADGATLACYDIPLLFETHQQDRYRPVVVVTAPEAERILRIVQRDGLEPSAVRERIAAQMPLSDKVAQADIVVDNDEDLEHLEQQAVAALEQVRRWST